MLDLILLVAGLAGVVLGAELVVRNGAGLAEKYGIPPVLVGMTIIALATSTPELAVGLSAARHGSPDLAVGNIIGTNLVNILLVLGLSAAIRAIAFEPRTLRVDLPVMTGTAIVLFLLARDGTLSTGDGLILTGIGLAYLAAIIVYGLKIVREQRTARTGAVAGVAAPADSAATSAKAAPADSAATSAKETGLDSAAVSAKGAGPSSARVIVLLLVGLAIVVGSSEVLVGGAVGIARDLGVSEAVIGLTIIALGTSAPELVTTIVSTVRNERDLAVGNLLGSSVFNIALVLGPTVLASTTAVTVSESLISSDLVLMAGVALLCVPAFWSRRSLGRVEGTLFVLAYIAYIVWMIISL